MGIRTFIAIEMAEEIRSRAHAVGQEIGGGLAGVKWVAAENMHLTLKFLGDVEPPMLAQVCAATSAAAANVEPFEISVERVGAFPNAGAARVVWVGVGDGAESLVALHAELQHRLQSLGFRREHKRFVPHLTLGRVRTNQLRQTLREGITRTQNWSGGRQWVDELVVFSSELTRQGPLYTPVGRSPLAKN